MNILAIDTSGLVAGVAIMKDGSIIHEIVAKHGLTHSQTIMPMVDDALNASSMSASDIDLFAAVVGPGSFTGVRIGVSTVKALAHALKKPLIGIDALEALAYNAVGFDGVVCPMLDARNAQVYAATFDLNNGITRLTEDAAEPIIDFIQRLPTKKVFVLGDGATVHADVLKLALGDRLVFAPEHVNYIRPATVAQLAYENRDKSTDHFLLAPLYLRAPQAERERAARLNNG